MRCWRKRRGYCRPAADSSIKSAVGSPTPWWPRSEPWRGTGSPHCFAGSALPAAPHRLAADGGRQVGQTQIAPLPQWTARWSNYKTGRIWVKTQALNLLVADTYVTKFTRPGNHCCDHGPHCGGVATVAVVRHPHGSQTRPNQLWEVQDGAEVHQGRDRAPWARVSDGTWGKKRSICRWRVVTVLL